MKDAKIIDFFSRRNMEDDGQDIEKNTKTIEENGKYLGSLPKEQGDRLRKENTRLKSRQEQIDAMAYHWANDYNTHLEDMLNQLKKNKVTLKNFDPETHDLYIDEDGHLWAVTLEGDFDE